MVLTGEAGSSAATFSMDLNSLTAVSEKIALLFSWEIAVVDEMF